MKTEEQYIDVNKALWNEKTKHHIGSAFYNVAGFLAGQTSLKEIELELLGNVNNKSLLHLQCHFGQDTLSWARMGVKATGVDLADGAIAEAQQLNKQLNLDAEFICSDIYDLPNHLEKKFDIVFTSYGTIGWLPDMNKWAKVVSHFLKPGGTFLIVEFHPVVWIFDNDFTYVQYPYFNKETIVENESGTYADRDAPMQLASISWNHNLAEVTQALIDNGLKIEVFSEYDYSPYDCFNKTVEIAPGKYNIQGMEGKMPMVYAIKATKI